VGPRTVLDAVVKREIPSLRRESDPPERLRKYRIPVYDQHSVVSGLFGTWSDCPSGLLFIVLKKDVVRECLLHLTQRVGCPIYG
jgi:hypothetical protein